MRRRFYLVLAAALIAGGVGAMKMGWLRKAAPREVLPMDTKVTDVELRCSAKMLDERAVEIGYEITNRSPTIIYVYLGTSQPDMVCDGGDGAVDVLLGIPPLPRDFTTTWAFHPETAAIAPGESKAGAVLVPVPIDEMSAYHDKPYSDADAVDVDKVRLLVDFVRPGTKGFDPKIVRGTGVPETVACVVAAPMKLRLRRRVDNQGDDLFNRHFERRGTKIF
jgi:hypothetical protein